MKTKGDWRRTSFKSHRVISRTTSQWAGAFEDLKEGLQRWPLWITLGWNDIRQRYRRSVVGPFWITLSMGAMVAGLGVLYAGLFRQPVSDYLPYLSVGLIVWGLVSSFLTEGCWSFIGGEGLIKQLPAPLSVHVYRIVWRNLLIFGHNLLIYVVIALAFGIWAGWQLVSAAAGLAVLLINGVWMAVLLGLLSARFRDIPPIVANVVQVLFFVTPIFWKPENLPERTVLVEGNPLFYLIEVVRAPLLGQSVSPEIWVVVVLLTITGWAVTFAFLARYHWRVAYWV